MPFVAPHRMGLGLQCFLAAWQGKGVHLQPPQSPRAQRFCKLVACAISRRLYAGALREVRGGTGNRSQECCLQPPCFTH